MQKAKKQEDCVSHHVNFDLQPSQWAQAAEDARLKIRDYERKIRRLKKAERVFQGYDKEGIPWPGKG